MIRLALFFLSIVSLIQLSAQTYVYPDRDIMFSDVICNVNGGHVLPGTDVMWSKAIVTCNQRGIYQGFSTSTFDVLFRFENNQ